jgi:hypothetical protein
MKTQLTFPGPRQSAYALMLTLFMVAISMTLLVATMSRLSGDADLNARSGQYNASLFAAEAAVERVIARMQYDYENGGENWISNNLSAYRDFCPGRDAGESNQVNGYWSNFQFSDARGNLNKTYLSVLGSDRVWQPASSQWPGLYAYTTTYRVISNAKQTKARFNLTNAVQQDIEFQSIPVFQFAIFYNGLLEFTWCAPMTVNGRTHANGNIFIGSASDLTFGSLVTATGLIYKTNWDGHALSTMTGNTRFPTNNAAGTPGYTTNVANLQLPIGVANTAAAVREIILMPTTNEPPTNALAEARYYNKAGVVVLVTNSFTNTVITVSVKTSMTDTPTNLVEVFATTATNKYVSTNFPWLTIGTNSFVEFRENQKKVKATDIDVGALKNWLPTNAFILSKFTTASGQYPNIFYVADLRDQGSLELAAVRLKNGSIIPTNGPPGGQPSGWTLATPNPLYVQGHYNLGPGGTAGSTNTSPTYPSSLISDALTILSGNWSDSYTNPATSRLAVDTTVNAAILTGTVFSNPTDWTDTNHFSGGVMNLPRLLENWTGDTLTMNTSIVNLFDSVRATNFFKNPGVYYNAPTRNWVFDNNFTNSAKLPPGTPTVQVVNRSNWRVPPPGVTNYAGR